MASCKDISILLSKSYDQDLGWWERASVRLHLLYCRGCRQLGKQLRFLRIAARRAAQAESLPGDVRLSDLAKRRIHDALQRY